MSVTMQLAKLARRLARLRAAVLAGAALSACANQPLTTPSSSDSPSGPPVASGTVTPRADSGFVGRSVQFSAEPRDASGSRLTGRTIAWASSASAVATVDAGGQVSVVGAGQATITATSEGKSGSGLVVGTVPPSGSRTGYYAAPGGSSGGDGSLSRPWNLSTALAGAGGTVQPGDTIWLRGGTYRGNYISTVRGSAAAPVVVRQFPGERAIIDGVGTATTTSVLAVRGAVGLGSSSAPITGPDFDVFLVTIL